MLVFPVISYHSPKLMEKVISRFIIEPKFNTFRVVLFLISDAVQYYTHLNYSLVWGGGRGRVVQAQYNKSFFEKVKEHWIIVSLYFNLNQYVSFTR